MVKPKTKKETPSTSSKDDTTRKRKKNTEKKNKLKHSFTVMLSENEVQSCANHEKRDDNELLSTSSTTEIGDGNAKKNISTPKCEKLNVSEMETPEARTQTRLTLKYEDLLLSQTIDPQCEVSWECISPKVIQRIYKDIQRKPNIDFGKVLPIFADDDDSPSNSGDTNNNNTEQYTKQCTSLQKKVPVKRKLKSRKSSSKMEEMIQKLEILIKNEANENILNDSMNLERSPDSLELKDTLRDSSAENKKETNSSPNFSKNCLSSVNEHPEAKGKSPLVRTFNSCGLENEETSWSDDELFETFIAKVAQTSENKFSAKIDATKVAQLDSDNKKTPYKCRKSSPSLPIKSVGLKSENKDLNFVRSNEKVFKKVEPALNTSKTSINPEDNFVLQDFSDSDTDELLSQLTDQEICCTVQLQENRNSSTSESSSIQNSNPISGSAPVSGVAGFTDKKGASAIKKKPIKSVLDFLDLPFHNHSQPTSSRKISETVQSNSYTKNKFYNFRNFKTSTNHNNNNNMSGSQSSNQISIEPRLENHFDDPFGDKDDDILKCAESFEENVMKPQKINPLVIKTSSYNLSTLKQQQAQCPVKVISKTVCSKEEIERKKREAIHRRKLRALSSLNKK